MGVGYTVQQFQGQRFPFSLHWFTLGIFLWFPFSLYNSHWLIHSLLLPVYKCGPINATGSLSVYNVPIGLLLASFCPQVQLFSGSQDPTHFILLPPPPIHPQSAPVYKCGPFQRTRISFSTHWFMLSSTPSPPFPITLTILSQMAYSSTLRMGAGSLKMLVNIYQTIWHHISEDSNVQCC